MNALLFLILRIGLIERQTLTFNSFSAAIQVNALKVPDMGGL